MRENLHLGFVTIHAETRSYIGMNDEPVTVKVVRAASGSEIYKLLVLGEDGWDIQNDEWFEPSYADLASARQARRLHIEKFQKKNTG